MSDTTSFLQTALAASPLSLDAGAVARLARYGEALLDLNREINLTAARTPEKMLEILLLPSIGLKVAWAAETSPAWILDIGSGNGFPGVAAAVLWPEAEVILVERRAKKARAIETCLQTAGIENASALDCDAREVKNHRPDLMGHMDLVTIRAVGPLDDTTALAVPFLARGGCIVHWKGTALTSAERGSGREAAQGLGLDGLPDIMQPEGRGIFVRYVRPLPESAEGARS